MRGFFLSYESWQPLPSLLAPVTQAELLRKPHASRFLPLAGGGAPDDLL